MVKSPGVRKGRLRNEDDLSVCSGQGKGGLAAQAHSHGPFALNGYGIEGQNSEKMNR